MALHCIECGFVNAEAANYCQRCGALLPREDGSGDPITATYRVGEDGELIPEEQGPSDSGPALVIYAGGGRAGEAFAISGERATIGRRESSDILLDDVTVSRDHAVLSRRGHEWFLDDGGSLNGTYVNRQRIDSVQLHHGDEVQIGKYRMTFYER